MNIDAWLAAAMSDADRIGLPDLKPLLESLAESTRALRAADWNDAADVQKESGPRTDGAARRQDPFRPRALA